MQEHCYNSLDYMNCDAVLGFCSSELYEPIEAIGGTIDAVLSFDIASHTQRVGNPFDMSKSCSSQNNPTCYAEAECVLLHLSPKPPSNCLH
jgi:hypothetical protein